MMKASAKKKIKLLSELQGLSSQLSGLQIDLSQPPEQLEIGLKHQCVPYLVQFYTYFFIIH